MSSNISYEIDKVASLCKSGSFRLVSLLDMLQVYADKYIRMGRLLQMLLYSQRLAKNPDKLPLPETLEIIKTHIRNLLDECTELQLDVSGGIISNYLDGLDKRPFYLPTWAEIVKESDFFSRSILQELKSRLFLFIFPHRASYFNGENLLNSDVITNFPSSEYDIKQAGKCYAIECYTAAVNHLMKVVEYGLIAFADFCGVPNEDRANWNKALNLIDKALKDKTHPNLTGMTREDEQYYSEGFCMAKKHKECLEKSIVSCS